MQYSLKAKQIRETHPAFREMYILLQSFALEFTSFLCKNVTMVRAWKELRATERARLQYAVPARRVAYIQRLSDAYFIFEKCTAPSGLAWWASTWRDSLLVSRHRVTETCILWLTSLTLHWLVWLRHLCILLVFGRKPMYTVHNVLIPKMKLLLDGDGLCHVVEEYSSIARLGVGL